MNDKVDVLAVMDALHDCWKNPALKEARAAVAELIEAANAMQERIAYYASLGEDAIPNIEDWSYTDNSGDMARFRAALARIGGAA